MYLQSKPNHSSHYKVEINTVRILRHKISLNQSIPEILYIPVIFTLNSITLIFIQTQPLCRVFFPRANPTFMLHLFPRSKRNLYAASFPGSKSNLYAVSFSSEQTQPSLCRVYIFGANPTFMPRLFPQSKFNLHASSFSPEQTQPLCCVFFNGVRS